MLPWHMCISTINKSHCLRGGRSFLFAQSEDQPGTANNAVQHWTAAMRINGWGQQTALELGFRIPSKPISEDCLSSGPASRESTSFRSTAPFRLSLCSSEADGGWVGMLCGIIAAVGFSFSEMFSVKRLSCSLGFFHFSPCSSLRPWLPLPTPRKTQGN